MRPTEPQTWLLFFLVCMWCLYLVKKQEVAGFKNGNRSQVLGLPHGLPGRGKHQARRLFLKVRGLQNGDDGRPARSCFARSSSQVILSTSNLFPPSTILLDNLNVLFIPSNCERNSPDGLQELLTVFIALLAHHTYNQKQQDQQETSRDKQAVVEPHIP